jgi:hypothetical protein
VTTGTDERLRRFARSRRFLLGRPRDLAFVPGRLLFLRALDHPFVQFSGERVDLTGQLRVGLELQLLFGEVVVALACWKAACRFWPS